MDGWDVALWILAAYVAVVALVRMMLAHREQATARLRIELEQQKRLAPHENPTTPAKKAA